MKIKKLLFLLTIFVVCTITIASLSSTQCELQETVYIVQNGDCLWIIASDYCPDSMSKWDYIELVEERNNIEHSIIYPGQELIVFKTTD